MIRTVHFSLRIHIFEHATKLGCLYFGFRQSNQYRPSFKPYACIPDLFDEIALMFRLLRTISVSCTTFTSQVTFHKSEKIARDTDRRSLYHKRTRLIWGVYISNFIHFESEIQFFLLTFVYQVFGVFSPISPRMDASFCRFGKSYFFTCRPQFKVSLAIRPKTKYIVQCFIWRTTSSFHQRFFFTYARDP